MIDGYTITSKDVQEYLLISIDENYRLVYSRDCDQK